ncbi:helix-turn-helix domain-containing protein [Paenibacillus flagellatus]|uniref:AraC family transcriptional regulator n=1 Tax=Paenibacillus flagellatus TaxID=2211139 RepID=A0A2V5K0G4_9BACL|nr:helix-turn-helix domain-containing protein [Paenibacillus flagellatus]PYI52618.1 AraC family transcriptional regulator [Paenibacillus flagellatus]
MRLFKRTTFKRKLYVYSLLLYIVPVLVLGTVSSTIASRMVQEEVDHNHQIILRQIQFQVDRFLQTLEKASIELANSTVIEKSVEAGPSIQTYDLTMDMMELLQKQRNFSEIQYDVSVIYNRYLKVYSSRSGLIDFSDFAYADIARQLSDSASGPVVISPKTYPYQNELLVIRPVPLFYADRANGYIMLHVQSSKLTSFVQGVQLGERRKLLVLDENGTVVASHNPAEIGTRIYSSELYRYWNDPQQATAEVELDGVSYQVSMERSMFNNWTYLALTESTLLTGKSQRIQTLTWVIVAALVALWMLIALVGARSLYNPIQRLSAKFSGDGRGGKSPRDGLEALDSFIHHVVMTNDRLQHKLNEQLPYLKETVFQQLLRGEMDDREIREKTEQYGFPLKGNWFCVCLVDVDEFGRFRQTYREKDRSLMLYALRKMCEELCEELPQASCITAAPLPGQVAIIIGLDRVSDGIERKVTEMVAQINGKVRQYFQFTVTVTLSDPVKDYRGISDAYQQALELLSYRLLLGHSQLITNRDLKPSVQQSRTTIVKWQKRIVSSIAQGDLEGAAAQLDEMMRLVPLYVQNSETVLGLFAYLIGELDVLMQEIGLDPKTFFPDDPYKELYAKTSLDEVKEWLTGAIFPAVARHMGGLRMSKQKAQIQQVLAYIHDHYDTDLSLQQVAERFGMSPSQLSRSFKEETDTHFGDYLIHYRMEKAKEFLVHTDMPIKDISEKLCYTSVQNFTRIFKQTVQIPPGQYRKQFRDADYEAGAAEEDETS